MFDMKILRLFIYLKNLTSLLQHFDCGIIWFVIVASIQPSRSINHEESEKRLEAFTKKEGHNGEENEAEISTWTFLNSVKMLRITKTKFWTIIRSWKAVIKSQNSPCRN